MKKKEYIYPLVPQDPLMLSQRKIPSDVLGSYTGLTDGDQPVQDADDL